MGSNLVTDADLGQFFWSSTDLMSILASDGRWMVVNSAWPDSMGWSLDDLRSGPFLDLIHPDDVDSTIVEFNRLLAAPDATLVAFVNRQRHRDGSYRSIEWSCQGRDGLVFSAGRDITRRVKDQARLAESLETTRSILNAVADPIIVIDRDLCLIEAGPATEQMHGLAVAGRHGQSVLDVIHPDDRAKVAAAFQRAFDEDEVVGLHYRVSHVDGHAIPVEARVRSLSNDLDPPTRVVIVARDITQSVADATALAESVDLTRAILDAAPDSIIVIDEDLIVIEVSPGTASTYGIAQRERYGRSAMEIVHPDDRAAVGAVLERLFQIRTDGLTTYRFRARHSDGHWLTMETRARLLRDAEGRGRQAVLVSRDITDAVASHAALEEQKATADRRNIEKSEYVSRMSHEVRTPLNAVLGFAEILQMEAHTPAQEEMLGYIRSSGQHLLALINDVMDMSRVEAGAINLLREPVALREVVVECANLIGPQARTTNIDIINDVDGASVIDADRQRLKQVIVNLLSNAIKYNRPSGSVTVSCSAHEDQVRLSFTDTGIGISPAMMQRLFTPFDRLDAEATDVEGTGLGLSLSKSLAEAMGGTLGVVSVPGAGSTFWIELPFSAESNPPSSVVPLGSLPSAGPSPITEASILYIDDTVANLRLVEYLLASRPGLRLYTATLGREGLELARKHHPDLILLDAWLPDLHGAHILRRLRDDPATASIPVIVVSADSSAGQMRRFRDAGVEEFLAKPLNLQHLLSVIDAHLSTLAS
jgi:PAS domain S-box-containing protein